MRWRVWDVEECGGRGRGREARVERCSRLRFAATAGVGCGGGEV